MKPKYIATSLQCAALSFLVFTLPSTVKAEKAVKRVTKPFLWKVEGKGLTKPSHLFGTIHVSDPAVTTLHPAVKKAFDGADHFHAEINMAPENQMAMIPLIMRKDGKTLDESIGKDLAKQLNEELARISPQLNSAPFQTMKTWLVATMPSLLPDQLSGKAPLDLNLWQDAEKAKKKTSGLEKVEDQMKGFNELTEPEQVTFMKESLTQLKKDRVAEVSMRDQMINTYLAGDKDKLLKLMSASLLSLIEGGDKALGNKLWNSVLVARDKTITTAMIKALKAEPRSSHFFAVGAGHYCTDKSILFHLKEAGYTVTRIEK